MNVSKPVKMTADEFIAWGLQQESGRYELERGEVLTMSPERKGHIRTKAQIWRLLDDAIATAGIDAEVLADGTSVRVDNENVYEPDAVVLPGPRGEDSDVTATDPVIVVEVLSPSTARRDSVTKFAGYFSLPSVLHYLILDTEEPRVIHHSRQADGTIRAETLTEGRLVLDPPGLELDVGAIFSRLARERNRNG